MPRFAANLSLMFTEHAFLDRFAAASEAGFSAVEFLFPYDHPPEDIRRRAEAAGVEIVLFNMPPGDWAAGERGLAVFPERAAEFSAALGQALDYARVLGVPRLHMMAGIAASDDRAAGARYRAALAEAADRAAPAGIDILIEPLNPRDMPGYFLADFEAAAAIIAELGRPNVKLQFDIYHRQILHGDVVTGLRRMLDHRPCADRLCAAAARAGDGGAGRSPRFRSARRHGLCRPCGLRIPAAERHARGLGWLSRYR